MRALIEPTAALVAIDVDMAAATAGRDAKQAKQEAANRAALPALARQIRLRNLSGAILVDLAGLSMRRRPGWPTPSAPPWRPTRRATPAGLHRRRAGGDPAPARPSAAARVAGRPARRRAGGIAPARDPRRRAPARAARRPRVVSALRRTRWRCPPLRTGSAAPLCCAPTRRCPPAPGHRGALAWLSLPDLRPDLRADPPTRLRPFCSPRCADVDLGRWFTGQYRVPARPDGGGARPRTLDPRRAFR